MSTVGANDVPVDKFSAWLNARLAAEGVWDPVTRKPVKDAHKDGLRSINEIATDWGLSPRTLLRVLRMEQRMIAEETVDRAFCRAGEPYLTIELYG